MFVAVYLLGIRDKILRNHCSGDQALSLLNPKTCFIKSDLIVVLNRYTAMTFSPLRHSSVGGDVS